MGNEAVLGRDFMEMYGMSINLDTFDTYKDINFNNNTDNLNLLYETKRKPLAISELANDCFTDCQRNTTKNEIVKDLLLHQKKIALIQEIRR